MNLYDISNIQFFNIYHSFLLRFKNEILHFDSCPYFGISEFYQIRRTKHLT